MTRPPAEADPFAVLFDVDGTLVDSNYLHVHAWARAFREENIDVAAWQIHRSIGMDGSSLVTALSGDASEAVQQRLKDRHSSLYKDRADLIVRLPGARELLHHLAGNGVRVVLASSAPDDELAITRKVLDSDDAIFAATSSKDVDTAKPDPSIVEVARSSGPACPPIERSSSATRCGTVKPPRASTCPSSVCGAAASPIVNSKKPGRRRFSMIRTTCSNAWTRPLSPLKSTRRSTRRSERGGRGDLTAGVERVF